MAEEVELKWISGFWRRVGALFVDTLVLGIVGFVLSLVFGSVFIQIGAWGRLIGFVIALVYFGVMNSKVSEGQTLGKKALKLRVVNSDNVPISVGRSILRYIILAVPFSLNGAHFSSEVMLSYLIYPLSLIMFGGLFATFYLYIFNRVTRQSLHDLIVGTFVVNAGVKRQETGTVWKVHFIIIVVLFVVAAIAPAFTTQLAQREPFKEMLSAQTVLTNEADVTYATVSTNTTTFSAMNNGTKTTTYVSAQVFLTNNDISDAEFARDLAVLLIANYPEAKNKDAIQITLTYGYDIGIWSKWYNHAHNFSPAELQSTE